MIILKPISTAQTLKFIARENEADSVIIRDEQNNTEATISGTFTVSTYYLTASLTFSLEEGKFYNLKVLNGTDIVYRDKIFATSQTLSEYSINSGDYIEHSDENQFITI